MIKYILFSLLFSVNVYSITFFAPQESIKANDINQNFTQTSQHLQSQLINLNFNTFSTGQLINKDTIEAELNKVRSFFTVPNILSNQISSEEINNIFIRMNSYCHINNGEGSLGFNNISNTFGSQCIVQTCSGGRIPSLDNLSCVFMEAQGGSVQTIGDYKIHSFLNNDQLNIQNIASGHSVEYLVIGGGGAGGGQQAFGNGGGGGGAGGYREGFTNPSSGIHPVIVGAGGIGAASTGQSGFPSSIFSIEAAGGGGGGAEFVGGNQGLSGGSGGAHASQSLTVRASGNVPAVTPPQGNDGGLMTGTTAGGGGGAGAMGQNAPAERTGGAGGAGKASNITGTLIFRAGGGGGGSYTGGGSVTGGAGGIGGGGAGASATLRSNNPGFNAMPNTGGGGGGSTTYTAVVPGGSGGSGIVIIKYRYK